MVPTESSAVRITRQRTSSRTRPKCSTGRALKRGSRYDAVSRGERSCGRSAGGCSSVRRPSSTAASSRAACASPTPGTRHKASRDDRVRRWSPPTADSRPLARSRAPRLRWPDPSTTATSSLSPSASAPTRTSFSRGRSAAASAFTPRSLPRIPGRRRRLPYTFWRCRASARSLDPWPRCSLGAAVLVACAEPPTREISQAQGALDAARAAGAEAYAQDRVPGRRRRPQEGARRRRRARLPPGPELRARRARAGADRRARSGRGPGPRRHRRRPGDPGRGPRRRDRAHAPRRSRGHARAARPPRAGARRAHHAIARSALSGRGRRLRARGGADQGDRGTARRGHRRPAAPLTRDQSPTSGPSSVTAATITTKLTRSSSRPWRIIAPIGT